MLALLGAAAAVAAVQAPASPGCYQSLCNSEAIAPFLARLRAARPNAGAPVHIIQIGDSHTAGDNITQGWRSRLQAAHGNGGRGVLAAGKPYQGYITWGVTASQSAGWRVNATFGSRYQDGGAPLGISGFTQTVSAAGETVGVTADSPDQNFDRVILCAIAQPAGRTVRHVYEALRDEILADLRAAMPVDAVQLLKTAEGWKIVSLADTFVREGCEHHPPPAPK